MVQQRPIVRNLSLAGRVKVERVAELLQRSGNEVEIISQGEVTQRQLRVYPGFVDPKPFNARIPVVYSSAFPVRFLNGLWSSLSTLRIFKARHRVSPFDVVLIYNLKPPQVTCARYAIRRLGLPVILEYEDGFDGVWANKDGFTSNYYVSQAKSLLGSVSACMAVSPYLLSQTASSIPKLLLRGVVGDAFLAEQNSSKRNWVVFSGTHDPTQGLEQLIKAWQMIKAPDWELHIAGNGSITATLKKMAENDPAIIFHGLLDQQENARLLCSAKIGMNPMNASRIRGSDFPFKIIEYLAAGLHVITTPRGALEPELEAGISYIGDNAPETIAASLEKAIAEQRGERSAQTAAVQTYGSAAVARSLNNLLAQVSPRSAQIRESEPASAI